MSKRTYFKRYLWLYDLIKTQSYISFQEIEERFYKSSLFMDDNANFSKRTFHRDIKEIDELFEIEVLYSKSKCGYFIEGEDINSNLDLLIDSYRIINTFHNFKDLHNYVTSEPFRSGSEHLIIFLNAIKNRREIEFSYSKYIDNVEQKRIVQPYFLKEYKHRWYVIAKDKKDGKTKTFALDRIMNTSFTLSPKACYDIPREITPNKYFADCFGIFCLPNTEPQIVELAFKPLKGKFIKSQPLHHSQKIILENQDELRVQLYIQITHDFIMELLSHGCEVKVISPISLIEEMKKIITENLNQY